MAVIMKDKVNPNMPRVSQQERRRAKPIATIIGVSTMKK